MLPVIPTAPVAVSTTLKRTRHLDAADIEGETQSPINKKTKGTVNGVKGEKIRTCKWTGPEVNYFNNLFFVFGEF